MWVWPEVDESKIRRPVSIGRDRIAAMSPLLEAICPRPLLETHWLIRKLDIKYSRVNAKSKKLDRLRLGSGCSIDITKIQRSTGHRIISVVLALLCAS